AVARNLQGPRHLSAGLPSLYALTTTVSVYPHYGDNRAIFCGLAVSDEWCVEEIATRCQNPSQNSILSTGRGEEMTDVDENDKHCEEERICEKDAKVFEGQRLMWDESSGWRPRGRLA
ncbi:hypothetical protein KUCAC02_020234, partial [Chaenocephalus aceratus]